MRLSLPLGSILRALPRSLPLATTLLAICALRLGAQTLDSALAYYPLQVGDERQYVRWTDGVGGGPPNTYLYTERVTADTVMAGGWHYLKIESPSGTRFERVDSVWATLFRYTPELAADAPVETFYCPDFPCPCVTYGTTSEFGDPIATFTKECGSGTKVIYGYGLGLIYRAEPDGRNVHYTRLVSAVVGGRRYDRSLSAPNGPATGLELRLSSIEP